MLRNWPEIDRSTHGLTRAILIAESIEDSTDDARFQQQFDELQAAIGKKIKPKYSPKKKSEKIFKYLHKNVFQKYVLIAKFSETFSTHKYNCVTSTILFSLLATHFEIPHTVYLTPNHAFAVVDDEKDKRITVELTNPKNGFDYKDGQAEYIQYLLEYKLITAKELTEKGAMQIYDEYIEERRAVEPVLLTGVTYANMAADAATRNQFDRALCEMKKALRIDPNYEAYALRYKYYMANLISGAPSEYLRYWDALTQSFRLFPQDTLFTNQIWTAVRAVFHELIHQKKDYEQAKMLSHRLKEMLSQNSRFGQRIANVDHDILAAETESLLLRGNFQKAYEQLLPIANLYRQLPWFQEMHVDVGTRYAYQRVQFGDIETALSVLDTLIAIYPDFKILRSTYVDYVSLHISGSMFNRENYELSEKYLLKAWRVAPDHHRLNQMLPMFYHEMAMAKVRAHQFRTARRVAERGLKLFPNDKRLNEAFDQIIDAIAYEKSKDKL